MVDLYVDPIGAAEEAASAIAELTGKDHHSMAFVMGSGWIDAVEQFGTPTHEIQLSSTWFRKINRTGTWIISSFVFTPARWKRAIKYSGISGTNTLV